MTIQEFLGIELPVVQAPMASSQGSALTIAVSNAGGLGSLPAALLRPDDLRRELSELRTHCRKPFNVNFFCHALPPPDPTREAAWRTSLAPYYAEFGITAASIPAIPPRMPFNAEALAVLAEFRPPVVSFHFGLPAPELLAPLREWGTQVWSSATTVAEAQWLEAHGVDAVIAQGLEAGGHRGLFLTDDLSTQVGTLALVPQVVRAVKVPVVAAGGIASREGVAAALRLGAVAAQVGTAYLLCPEALTTPLHRAALQGEAARHTVLTNLFTGRPARSIVNRFIREHGPLHPEAPRFPGAAEAVGPLRAHAERLGSSDFSPLWAGQNATGCKAIPAAELTKQLAP